MHRLELRGECLDLAGALGHVGGATRSRGVGGTRGRHRHSTGAERPRRTHAALASSRPVLVGTRRAGDALARPRPVLVIPRCTRGARCPVGPVVPFLCEERFDNNEGPQPESSLKLCHFTTLVQTGG